MRKQKLYLETTLFNYYFDDDKGFAHNSTVSLFMEIADGKYEAFTSRFVINEQCSGSQCDKIINLIFKYDIPILETSDEAMRIADLYIEEQIIPQKNRTDVLHIAIATVNELDMIISINFQHIAKRKTKIGTGNINAPNGYRNLKICAPWRWLRMKTISPIEQEVNQICLKIHEKTKDMTPAQLSKYYRQSTEATIQKHSLKVITNAKDNNTQEAFTK